MSLLSRTCEYNKLYFHEPLLWLPLWLHQCCVLIHFSCVPLLWPYVLNPTRLLCPWDFPGKNTGVGCHLLLQGIFPTQQASLHLFCLLHCQAGSLPLAPPGTDSHKTLQSKYLTKTWMVLCYKSYFVFSISYLIQHFYFSYLPMSLWISSSLLLNAGSSPWYLHHICSYTFP